MAGFVRALNHAIKDIVANPQLGIDAIHRRDPLADTDLETRRLALTIALMATPTVMQNGIGGIDAQRFQMSIEQVSKVCGLKTTPDASALFDASFLPPKAERMLPASK